MQTYLVFVYGTLRKGGIYHDLLKDAVLIKENYSLSGFRLYDFQHWYPYMVKGDFKDTVIGEVYQIDEAMLQELHILEDIENEVYRFVYLSEHQFYTYIKFDDQVVDLTPIPEGDWIDYMNRLRNESWCIE